MLSKSERYLLKEAIRDAVREHIGVAEYKTISKNEVELICKDGSQIIKELLWDEFGVELYDRIFRYDEGARNPNYLGDAFIWPVNVEDVA